MIKKRESPFRVRLATIEDAEQCINLALEIPKENDMEYFPKPSFLKVAMMLEELINAKLLIVYENNGVICGLLGVKIDSFWWTDEPMMVDVLFYMKPDFRSYTAYRRMLQTAEEFAKINGVPLALLFFTTKDQDKKHRMVLRRGFKTVGFWVMKK